MTLTMQNMRPLLMRSVALPLWIALLAWPLTGASGAMQIGLSLMAAVLIFEGANRLFPKKLASPKSSGSITLRLGARLDTFRVAAMSKGLQKILLSLMIVLVLSLPFFLNNYYLDTINLALLYALLAMGLNITVGSTGLLDLGYAAFYGIGAYSYALLSTGLGLSFWLALPLGGGTAALFGLMLGWITLRLRGDYLAIITLGFVQIVYLCLNNWDSITQGPNGIMNIGRPQIGSFLFKTPLHFYYLLLIAVSLVAFGIHRLMHSQIGRAWVAIREDELAAEAMGINTMQIKIMAFSLGAAIAGISGVFFAARYTFISPESFTFLESVRILSMVVLGGMGSLPGAILGAFLLTILPELLRDLASYRMLIFGMALVLMMVFRPQGLLGKRV